jgi:hypothetical protein
MRKRAQIVADKGDGEKKIRGRDSGFIEAYYRVEVRAVSRRPPLFALLPLRTFAFFCPVCLFCLLLPSSAISCVLMH